MNVDTRGAAALLQKMDRVLILTHKNPDGDTLGSAAALCRALLSLGKQARIVNAEPIPPKYDYLFEGLPDESFEPDAVVAVDVADVKLLGDPLEEQYADRIDLCIDHHLSNKHFAKALLLEDDDAAAVMPVYRVLQELNVDITPAIATALYTGLSTDTGCFRYSNASAEAYRMGAEFIDRGADNADINVRMFETKSLGYFQLLSRVLESMRLFCGGQVSVLKITRRMLDETGNADDACEPLASISRQIEGVKCGITMRQKKDGTYKFSLRTHEPLDASRLGALLGGGGHMRAAGCDAGPDEEESLQILLTQIAKELDCSVE